MNSLGLNFSGRTVLEFGSGLGGNLISICSDVKFGYGVDVNSGYTKLARRLAEKSNASNLAFRTIRPGEALHLDPVDVAFSLGVFERLSKIQVGEAVRLIADSTRVGGTVALYFLSPRALVTDFTARLGPAGYVTWSDLEIDQVCRAAGIRVERRTAWPPQSNLQPVATLVIGERVKSCLDDLAPVGNRSPRPAA